MFLTNPTDGEYSDGFLWNSAQVTWDERYIYAQPITTPPSVGTVLLSKPIGTGDITQTFGNVAGWQYTVAGGSRIYLAEEDTNNTTAPISYMKVDCRKEARVSFTCNLETLPAGVVFASYMVPMKRHMTNCWSFINNSTLESQLPTTLYDEWGLGYGDGQGVFDTFATEIDLFEASGIGGQVTLHGRQRSKTIVDGVATYDTADLYYDASYEGGRATGQVRVDQPGVWQSVHGTGDDIQLFNDTATGGSATGSNLKGSYDPYTYGPGANFQINTLLPFDVDCIIKGPYHPEGIADSVILIAILTQGSNSLTFKITSPGFPDEDLEEMVYVQSIWATDTVSSTTDTSANSNSWWLDGVNPDSSIRIANGVDGDQRTWATPDYIAHPMASIYQSPPTEVIGASPTPFAHWYASYHAYSTPIAWAIKSPANAQNIIDAKDYPAVCARVANFGISYITDSSTTVLPMVWVLDCKYRGVENQTTVGNWTGKYMATYGIYMSDINHIDTPIDTLTNGWITRADSGTRATDAQVLSSSRTYAAGMIENMDGSYVDWDGQPKTSQYLELYLESRLTEYYGNPTDEGNEAFDDGYDLTLSINWNKMPSQGVFVAKTRGTF